MGNTCCEKDLEAVKSDTQDFRKKRTGVSPWIYIWSPCEGTSGAEVQQLLPPEHLYRAHKRCHFHMKLIFLFAFLQEWDRLGACQWGLAEGVVAGD